MKNIIDLAGKKILVTGASGGIGGAVSVLLSQLEASVILLGRNREKLYNTLTQMEQQDRHQIHCIDLASQLEGIEGVIADSVRVDGKKFDGLVHCAGIAPTGPLRMLSYERMEVLIRLNYYAYVELVRQLEKRKYHNEWCSIVGISSVASNNGKRGQIAYSAAKGAMDAATVPLARELAEKKIRINTIRPGWVESDLTRAFCEFKEFHMEDLDKQQYLGIAQPEDIANVAAFLLSSASCNITGQSLVIDGGGFIV